MQNLLGPARWRLTRHWRTLPRHHEGDLAAEAFLVKVKSLLALAVEIQVRIQRHSSCSSRDLLPSAEIWRPARVTLRDALHDVCDPKLLITCAQRRDELRHRLVAFQSTEAFDGFEHARGDPAYHLLSAAPSLDVPFHVSGAADETLGRICRRERPTQRLREIQRGHGERFVEPFAHA